MFRRTGAFDILQDSIFAPIDYRYNDALALAKEIEREGWAMHFLFQYPGINHFYEDEESVLNTHDSYAERLSRHVGRRLIVPLYVKPSIIRRLGGRESGKANKILCNAYF